MREEKSKENQNEELIKVLNKLSLLEKINLASNEKTHIDILVELSKQKGIKVSLALIENKSATKDIIKNILTKDEQTLNQKIAQQPYIDNELFIELLKTRDEYVFLALAKNHSLKNIDCKEQLNILENQWIPSFWNNTEEKIEEALIDNPFVSKKILLRLSDSKFEKTRKLLVELTTIDDESLEILAKDENRNIAIKALSRLRGVEDFIKYTTLDKVKFLSDIKLNHETLTLFSEDDSLPVRVAVAKHPNITPEIFELFINKKEKDSVYISLSHNLAIENIPIDLQKKLLDKNIFNCNLGLARNINIHPVIMNAISEMECNAYKQGLLENPNIDKTSLEIMTYDEEEDISKLAKKVLDEKELEFTPFINYEPLLEEIENKAPINNIKIVNRYYLLAVITLGMITCILFFLIKSPIIVDKYGFVKITDIFQTQQSTSSMKN